MKTKHSIKYTENRLRRYISKTTLLVTFFRGGQFTFVILTNVIHHKRLLFFVHTTVFKLFVLVFFFQSVCLHWLTIYTCFVNELTPFLTQYLKPYKNLGLDRSKRRHLGNDEV